MYISHILNLDVSQRIQIILPIHLSGLLLLICPAPGCRSFTHSREQLNNWWNKKSRTYKCALVFAVGVARQDRSRLDAIPFPKSTHAYTYAIHAMQITKHNSLIVRKEWKDGRDADIKYKWMTRSRAQSPKQTTRDAFKKTHIYIYMHIADVWYINHVTKRSSTHHTQIMKYKHNSRLLCACDFDFITNASWKSSLCKGCSKSRASNLFTSVGWVWNFLRRSAICLMHVLRITFMNVTSFIFLY